MRSKSCHWSPRSRVLALSIVCVAWSCGDAAGSSTQSGLSGADAAVSGKVDAGKSSIPPAVSTTPSGSATGPKLADGIVGTACSGDSDCGSGTCMQTIPIVNTAYPGGYCTGSCYSDDQCGANAVCAPGILGRAGSCYLRCDAAAGCPREGYRCKVVSDVGRCIAAPQPLADHIAGSACTSDQDCGGGAMSCAAMLGANPAPDGYCTEACAIDEDCGAGGACINGISIVTIPSGRCVGACSSASDCREGYLCSPFGGPTGGPGACTPAADSDAGAP
jgi:hypothetical protein